MWKAILFDLDGTLLPVDTDLFLKKYFELMGQCVQDLYDPEGFVKHILAGSRKMIESDRPDKTNKEEFFEYFRAHVNLPASEMNQFFERFYSEEFPKLRFCVDEKNELPRKIVKSLISSGYQVAIATNPLFPREAIDHRLAWANIKDLPFDLITTYENMHYAKPDRRYYQEIADKLKVEPTDCLMVGNDFKEDLVAKKVGMDVFLVTDYLLDREDEATKGTLIPDGRGSLTELLNFLRKKLVLSL